MKYRIMRHFIRVYTDTNVAKTKMILRRRTKISQICDPSIYTMDQLRFTVSNQKEKSISAKKINR